MTYPQSASSVDLVFEVASTSGSPTSVDLVFGANSTPPPGAVFDAAFTCKFKLVGSAIVNYDNAVFRGLTATTAMPHSEAAVQVHSVAQPWSPGVAGLHVVGIPSDEAARMDVSTASAWGTTQAAVRNASALWDGTAQPVGNTASTQWQASRATHRVGNLRWQESNIGTTHSVQAISRHALATPRSVSTRWQQALATQRAANSPFGRAGKAHITQIEALWQQSLELASYGGPMYLAPPPALQPVRPDVAINLAFCTTYPEGGNVSPTLIFGLNPCGSVTPDSALYILPARFYMAVHSIEAHLLPSLSPIPIYDVSLQADAGSFAWTFAASGPTSLFDALAPTGGEPAQIRVTVDGLQWVFVVDSLQRQAEFGKTGARIAGRSATALVGAPYSRELARLNTGTQNAQQLAAAALNLSGVGLDWGITDWSVPAGAWSHTGTPLAAVQAIAESAGGYVASHRANPTLLVRHPYPTLPGGIPGGPWNWGGAFAADVELAPDSIITSSIERRDGPDVDGVYVSGTAQGVLALVRRTGTLGANLSAMVADPLITANAAASQRGLSVLGAVGAKHMVQISLPVLTGGANPGVLDVGQLVQINESVPWRGRVRSVSVQANMPSVRQSVTLERHLS